MAALQSMSINDHVGRLRLDEGTPVKVEQTVTAQMVDTPDGVKAMVGTLCSPEAATDSLYMDLEGVNLCRHGSISLIQIWVPRLQQAYLVDVHTLGKRAFNTSTADGRSLRHVLETKKVQKYFFDVRNDADALFALFDVRLAGVVDVQLLELASRRGSKYMVSGLSTCVEQEQALSGPALQRWQSTKAEGVKMFEPKHGGSYEVFNLRPLPQALVDYCVGDVQFLAALSAVYQPRLDREWLQEAKVETIKRLEESRSADYQPKGKHKAYGPKSWRFPQQKRVHKNKTTSAALSPHSDQVPAFASAATSRSHNSHRPGVSDQSPRGASSAGKKQFEDEGLRHQSIAFVSAKDDTRGQKKGQRGSKKGSRPPPKAAPFSSRSDDPVLGVLDEDQNWALCDKDCGWCGHCGDGVL